MNGIPIQSACDPQLPEEHCAWALVAIAGDSAQAPLLVPPSVLKQWSLHLYRCGFRHHPELQEIKYVLPASDSLPWLAGSAGVWVGVDEDLTPEQTAPDISHLTIDEKRQLQKLLHQELGEEK